MSDQLPLTPPEKPKASKTEIYWVVAIAAFLGFCAAAALWAAWSVHNSKIANNPKTAGVVSVSKAPTTNISTARPKVDEIARILYEEEFVIPPYETLENSPEKEKILIEFLTDLPKPAQPTPTTPIIGRIALIIDDIGVVPTYSKQAVALLPKEVTLAFLPYGESTPTLAKLAYERGHTVMVHLPMEPKVRKNGDVINPGPNALYTTDTSTTLIQKSRKNIAVLAPYAVGVNNHMGSLFTENTEGMHTVLTEIKNHNLFFIDSVTTSNSAAPVIAKNLGLTFAQRDIFIDHSQNPEDINAALAKAVQKAKQRGSVIAIAHPHPQTLAALQNWIPTLPQQGIALIPITDILK